MPTEIGPIFTDLFRNGMLSGRTFVLKTPTHRYVIIRSTPMAAIIRNRRDAFFSRIGR